VKLLIVDDNPGILELLSDSIECFGHDADTAKDGMEAADLLLDHHYDVVVTDAEMPRLGGFKLCRFIKAHFPHIRIIGMSGSLAGGAEFKKAGADFYLEKPISITQLQDAVEHRSYPLPR
jgi:CheY-like chemotaxis protein